MSTPISSSISYATPEDIRLAHDFRQCGDLLNDDGTRVTTEATFDANSKVQAALRKGVFIIEAACFRGNKYSVADLQALTGVARDGLVDLNVELAWWKLNLRRFNKMEIPPETAFAFSLIDALNSGEKIFPLQEQASAGNPSNGFMTQSEWLTLNPAIVQSQRYWGCRAWTRVPGNSSGSGSGCGCDD